MTSAIRILRLPEAYKAKELGKSSVYALQAKGRFPATGKITAQVVAWIEHPVQAWLADRIDQLRAHPYPSTGEPSVRRAQQGARKRGL